MYAVQDTLVRAAGQLHQDLLLLSVWAGGKSAVTHAVNALRADVAALSTSATPADTALRGYLGIFSDVLTATSIGADAALKSLHVAGTGCYSILKERSSNNPCHQRLEQMHRTLLSSLEAEHSELHACMADAMLLWQPWAQLLDRERARLAPIVSAVWELVAPNLPPDGPPALQVRTNVLDEIHAAVDTSTGEADGPDSIAWRVLVRINSGKSSRSCPIRHAPYAADGDGRACWLPCGCVVSDRARCGLLKRGGVCVLCGAPISAAKMDGSSTFPMSESDKTSISDTTMQLELRSADLSSGVLCIPSWELIPERGGDRIRARVSSSLHRILYAYKWCSGVGASEMPVAVEEVQFSGTDDDRTALENRLAVWTSAASATPSVVSLRGVCWGERATLIVTDKPVGTLEERVAAQSALSLNDVIRLGYELACALQAVHIHADSTHLALNPGNIYISSDTSAQLAGFLVPQRHPDMPLPATYKSLQTYLYTSPEQLLQGRGSTAADVYALGVTLLFAATGQTPCKSLSPQDYARAVATTGHVPLPDSLTSSGLRSLIASLTSISPGKRPSATAALEMLHQLAAEGEKKELCPVMQQPFTSTGGMAPLTMPCCGRDVSRAGLGRLRKGGVLECPACHGTLTVYSGLSTSGITSTSGSLLEYDSSDRVRANTERFLARFLVAFAWG